MFQIVGLFVYIMYDTLHPTQAVSCNFVRKFNFFSLCITGIFLYGQGDKSQTVPQLANDHVKRTVVCDL